MKSKAWTTVLLILLFTLGVVHAQTTNSTTSTTNTSTSTSSSTSTSTSTDTTTTTETCSGSTSSNSFKKIFGDAAIIYILGLIYVFGLIHLIYKRYFYCCMENIVDLIENGTDVYHPMVYSFMTTMIITFVSIFTMISTYRQIQIGVFLGTDMFNFLFIIPVIIFYNKNNVGFEPWYTARDTVYLLIGYGIVYFWVANQPETWWNWAVSFGYYIGYLLILAFNEGIHDTVLTWLGLMSENDSFDAAPLFEMKRRRDSITEIQDLIDQEDPTLKKKLIRTEGAVNIMVKDVHRAAILKKFQKMVYTVVFALRKKVKKEKERRTQRAHELYDPEQQKRKKNKKILGDEPKPEGELQLNDEQQPAVEDNNNFDFNKGIPEERSSHQGQDRDQMRRHQSSNLRGESSVRLDASREERKENQNPIQSRQFSSGFHSQDGGEPRSESMASGTHEQRPNLEDEYDYSLKIPPGIGMKIEYFAFFPLKLLCFAIMPRFKTNPTNRALGLSVILIMIMLGGLGYVVTWFIHEINRIYPSLSVTFLGTLIGGIGLSSPFLEYNAMISRQTTEIKFLQSFVYIAIFKIGVILPISWLAFDIAGVVADLCWNTGVSTTILIYMGFFLVMVLSVIPTKMEATKYHAGVFILAFIGFIVLTYVM